MRIVCPHCQTVATAEHVNMERLVAACPQCDEVFSFADALPPTVVSAPESPRGEPATPRSVTIRTTPDDGVEIRWRWFGTSVTSLISSTVVCWSILVLMCVLLWFDDDVPAIAMLAMILPVVFGITLIYRVLAGVFNSTIIQVTGDELRVNHGPLPWRRPHPLPTSVVQQITVESRLRRFRMSGTTQSPYQYVVRAHTTDRTIVVLLVASDREEADAIQAALRQALERTGRDR